MALNLTARLGLDGSGFQRGLKGAEGKVAQTAKRMAGLVAGAFSVGVISRGFINMLKEGGRIRDMAAGIGLTTDEFQAFEYAVEQSGGSIENVTKAIKKIAQAQADALQGQKMYQQAFTSLNVTMDDLRRKSPKELFLQLAGAVEKGELGVQNLAGFIDVIGRSTDMVLPSMQAGFASAAAEASNLGLVIKDDIVDELARLNDELTTMQYKWKNIKAEAATAAAGQAVNWWAGAQQSYNWWTTFFEGLISNPTGADTVADQWSDAISRANSSLEAVGEAALEEEEQAKDAAAKRIERAKKLAEEAQNAAAQVNADMESGATVKTATRQAAAAAFKPSSDALARIGGFTGTAGSRMENAIARTAQSVENIEVKLDRTFNLVARSGW